MYLTISTFPTLPVFSKLFELTRRYENTTITSWAVQDLLP